MREICASYRSCITRAHWGKNDRSFARIVEYFLGEFSAVGACSGRHRRVCCGATAFRPLYTISLWERDGASLGLGTMTYS